MAQEKLLPLLGLLLLLLSFCSSAIGEETIGKEAFKYRAADMEFAEDLAKRSRQIGMNGIKEKWLELQKMQQEQRQSGNNDLELDQLLNIDVLKKNNTLRVFVSSSMGVELLKHYVCQAKRYKAILVFNGLPGGSWRKLSDLVYEITEGEAIKMGVDEMSIQLDDMAFTEYSIKSVPAFVLSREESVFDADENSPKEFDRIVGNIGIRRVLEEIKKNGELSEAAQAILDEAKV